MLFPSRVERLFAPDSIDHLFGKLLLVFVVSLIALILAWQGKRMAWHLFSGTLQERRLISPARARTMQALLASLWAFIVYTMAVVIILGLFIPATALFPTLGLFSAAFGLGARPLVSDYLTGITLIFEYPFAVGDKVELNGIQGTVEAVNLRTTSLRSTTGELYIVPYGDIRVIRNFSRGAFSIASIHVTIPTRDLDRALPIVEALAEHVHQHLDGQLVEIPQLVSESGELGGTTTLTLVAKARFNQGVKVRRRLLELVSERLEGAGIAELA
ncbi:MAG TPA: hypothetical protein DEP84_12620 [Chloroflexi bacterium]|nr:hypothetical protein [Chloroflexota bacterium]